MDEYASSQSRGREISVVRLRCTSGHFNFVGANPTLSILYGSVSGIGNAADCKSVALAFLVQVQGGPPVGPKETLFNLG